MVGEPSRESQRSALRVTERRLDAASTCDDGGIALIAKRIGVSESTARRSLRLPQSQRTAV